MLSGSLHNLSDSINNNTFIESVFTKINRKIIFNKHNDIMILVSFYFLVEHLKTINIKITIIYVMLCFY